MDVAGFVIAIFALIFSIIALGLAMRALYIIGVNAGLDKKVRKIIQHQQLNQQLLLKSLKTQYAEMAIKLSTTKTH